VYDKDVYLEVHDPDYLQEASSTITRPTGGHPPVTGMLINYFLLSGKEKALLQGHVVVRR
jgi:hypothetical protein